jgi:NADH dehydrogenase
MSGVRSRVDAFVSWGWDYFSTNRTPAIVDRADVGRIDWGDEADDEHDVPPTAGDDGPRIPADSLPADDDHRREPDAIRAP